MRAIAKRGRVRLLAPAKVHRFALLGGDDDRIDPCSLMAAVAQWLTGAAATGAPRVFLTRREL